LAGNKNVPIEAEAMSAHAMTDNERAHLRKAINESGFPLQLGLKLLVQNDPHAHDWRVILSEHPWKDPLSETEKFIDLVIQGQGPGGPMRLVTECKRARETEWLFLREKTGNDPSDNRLNIRSRILTTAPSSFMDVWINAPFIPGSPQADFCVVRKGGKRSEELVEKTAAEVVRATEALALQEYHLHTGGSVVPRPGKKPISRLYIPMIVTTAKLYICDADYQKVDFQTGEVEGATITPVSVVRFAKSFAAGDAKRVGDISVQAFAEQTERSVLVVQAAAFAEFLGKFDMGRNTNANILEAISQGSGQ
jgi:hypothetical protein